MKSSNLRIQLITVCLFAYILLSTPAKCQLSETPIELKQKGGIIHGTLSVPLRDSRSIVALIVSGSGPTDRDGNNPAMNRSAATNNNSLRMFADSLLARGVSSLRYDKRGIAESKAAMTSEAELRFEDYVEDAAAWIAQLRKDKRFSKVIVIGHSEGSLIAVLAAQRSAVDMLISLAGAGVRADSIMRNQFMKQSGGIADLALPIIDSLVAGKTVEDVNPLLKSLFRRSVQPYLVSWFKYIPCDELSKLNIPILVAQGTTDLQVSVDDARALSKANPKAELILVSEMNHVLKTAPAERAQNLKAYTDPSLPIAASLIEAVNLFIQKNSKK